MAQAIGMGGVFFKARDPEALRAWYATHLGVTTQGPWMPEGGPMIFAPFEADTDYFGVPDQAFMLNFRVDDLDELCAALEAAGIKVITKDEWNSEIGRFARVHDPEGNPIELWEPMGPAAGA